MSEDVIQAACYQWYHNNYTIKGLGIMFSVPNGSNKKIIEALKFQATGLMPGVSDTMLNHKGTWYCPEFKKPGGVQSDNQKKFQARVELLGTRYFIFDSVEGFKNWVLSLG